MLKNLLRKININKDAKNVAKTYEMKLFVSCAGRRCASDITHKQSSNAWIYKRFLVVKTTLPHLFDHIIQPVQTLIAKSRYAMCIDATQIHLTGISLVRQRLHYKSFFPGFFRKQDSQADAYSLTTINLFKFRVNHYLLDVNTNAEC